MVSRTQLDRLASRIDAIAQRFAPPDPPIEAWIVEGDRAWPMGASDDDAIPYSELEARPPRPRSDGIPSRFVVQLVHPEPGGGGWLAACCLPGGECYALHGESGGNRPPGWTGAA